MRKRKRVVAVIVTFNRKELLSKVVERVLSQSSKVYRIIIVDNHSSDGTNDFVMSSCKVWNAKTNIVKYIDTGENLGGAGGFCFGFKIASTFNYDFLWLMDDDLLPNYDCLEKLLSHECSGIIQPTRFNLDGSCAELSPVNYNLVNPFFINPKRKSVRDVFCNDHEGLLEIDGVSFEGPLISRDVIESIGEPKADFFIFYDDLDYALRAKRSGFKVYSSSSARCTRLLLNNQNNDLASWKGYFMLRNFFHIHFLYGENFAVKAKPYIIVILLLVLFVFKFDISRVLVVLNAIKDARCLNGNERFKPR